MDAANDKAQVLVSVVLCTYNGEKFLRPQLDSILAQSWTNLELLVVDDASTDQTVSILKEYSQKDKRLKYTVNPRNLGYNANFEKAFTMAAADYIAISDQDDIWEPSKLETMMFAWPKEALFVYSLSGTFYGEDFSNRREAPNVRYGPISDLHPLVFSSPVHGHACMFKKELLEHCRPFPEKIYYDWWMSMHAAKISTIGCVPKTLSWHRLHPENSSRDILSLQNKNTRLQKLREQFVFSLSYFLEKKGVQNKEEEFLKEFCEELKKMDGKKFSLPMFRLILRERKKIFHYKKKKPLILFSQIKHAMRMARTGVL